VTICARHLLAQLEDARSGMRQLRGERQAAIQATEQMLLQETEQLRRGEQTLDHDVRSMREEVRTAVLEARKLVEAQEVKLQAAALEAKRARDQAALAYEASTRVGKDAEAHHARTATEVTEVRASVGDLGTEVRTILQVMQQNVSSLQEAETGQRLSVSRQALGAVAAMEERLLQRLAETRRELEAQQEQAAELHKSVCSSVGQDRTALSALEADLRDLRSRSEAGALSHSSAALLQQKEIPHAWRVALEDAVHRAQFVVDDARRQAENQHREIEVRLKALAAEHARTSVAKEAFARALGAEKSAETALRLAQAIEGSVKQLQYLAAEMRPLPSSCGPNCAQPAMQDGFSGHEGFPFIVVGHDSGFERRPNPALEH